MSDFVQSHRRQPTRLPRPWDSSGKDTGVGCHFLLQCKKVKSESEAAQSCPTLSDPMDCSPPGSSVHGIFKARVLEWGAIALSAWSSQKKEKATAWESSALGEPPRLSDRSVAAGGDRRRDGTLASPFSHLPVSSEPLSLLKSRWKPVWGGSFACSPSLPRTAEHSTGKS